MPLLNLAQRKTARVLFDESHNESWTTDPTTALHMQPSHPADSSYAKAAAALATRDFCIERNLVQPLLETTLQHADVVVIAHPSDTKWERTTQTGSPVFSAHEIRALQNFVRNGGGLVVLGETEQDKYGNNINDLIAPFGICIQNATLTDHAHCANQVPSWVFADGSATHQISGINLTEQVRDICFLRAGVITLNENYSAQIVLRAHATASTPNAGLVAAAQFGAGRVVVFADSDLFGDDDLSKHDHTQLWLNTLYWTAEHAFAAHAAFNAPANPAVSEEVTAHWHALKTATNQLRQLQHTDGSLSETADKTIATTLVRAMQTAIQNLTPHFEHEQAYLNCVIADLDLWLAHGFIKPDFTNALAAFRPELNRRDNIPNLVVFPLYTPNGSPDIRFEALLTHTPWHSWLNELERTQFDNAKFVPVHLIDFTDGYNSECAVLFPETVSVAGKPSAAANNFGGIFCDREAARYQRVVAAACKTLNVNLPPQASSFLRSRELIQDTFALWDLIHDRWHSHGELPFDPFMIRQRLPYWMYALEELRVDLQTYGSVGELEKQGFPFAHYVKYGILFDRIFRFPITGNRVRNYDGLSGQLLFAFLHKHNILAWRDNALWVDWSALDEGFAQLRERVEQLYRDGINMTKVHYWLAAHDFVSEWVKPNLGSQWAKTTRVFSDESQPKAWIDRVLNDEFPLSLFYVQLQKKLQG